MALCPQLPPSSPASCHPYPSPWSKPPPPTIQFKASRKLPTLKYPLTDITNFTVARPTLELSNAPVVGVDERLLGQARETYGDAPPRRGRGKNRRGRQRGARPLEVSGTMFGGAVIRSPIPLAVSSPRSSFHPAFRVARRKSTLASPVLSNASHLSSYNTTNGHPRTPRRRVPYVPLVSPETPRHGCKRTKQWTSNSPRGKCVGSPPTPPSPTPITRRQSRSNKPLPDAPTNFHLSSPVSLRFPMPPSSTPAIPRYSPYFNHGNQISLLPSMNLVSEVAQGQVRRKRTKRDLAELQWQIAMHKSLAWRTTHQHLNAEKRNGCDHRTMAKEDPSYGAMDFAQGGLKIAFERPACTCTSDNEPQTGKTDTQSHWTDSLDRELVKRLWVKLIAQGCRTIPTGISNPPQLSTPFPTVENTQRGIPFPSEQPEPPLAPAIQLSSTSRLLSHPQMGSGIPLRQRVSAITSSYKTPPQASLTNIHVSSPTPCTAATVSMRPTSSSAADPTYPDSRCQIPQVSARTPKGRLSSAQLTAQAILRHEDARLKPMRRGRPPGIMQRESSLRHEVTAEHAD